MMLKACLGMLLTCGLCAGLLFSLNGCGDGKPQACTKGKNDCPSNYSCINSLCRKACGKEADCEGTNESCKSGYCGGLAGSEKADPDGGPPKECSVGQNEDCYTGPKGTEGTGICKTGKRECNEDGTWGECKGEVKPKEFEECNQLDDNCNGKVDEECGQSCNLDATRECYPGDPKTKGVGICQAGKETCIKGKDGKPEWGQCEGVILPIPENCQNQADDNCNGEVNEGCKCVVGQSRECKADNGCAGIQSCQAKGDTSDWSVCLASKPRPEDCNGLDDDCNGKTDEDDKGNPLTRKCTNVCFDGIETCKGGKWKDCDAELPVDELCNNKDDDCDGKIDNVSGKDKPLIKGCDSGKPGLCKNGIRECKAGVYGDCIPPEPQKEICNNLDDNCDGTIDEDAAKPCGDGQKCIKDTLGVKKCIPE